MNNPILVAKGLRKTYTSGPQSVTVWKQVDIELGAGETLAIVGSSGSGKTTLLNVLGGLDSLDEGQVLLGGEDVHALGEAARTRLRNQSIGFVYQFHHLLPEFSALENVMLPQLLAGVATAAAEQRARECLERLGMASRCDHKPSELSGGERQRTAIARAIVNRPKLVLMDEPTGNLDQQTAAQVEAVMLELIKQVDTAFVLVTHDESLARRMDRCLRLKEQTLVSVDPVMG
ncbi:MULTISPECIES: ABC transporter ATP-binding protein [unclassified Oceanobacter]|uniref:ABC transporter ATP-binding protein n=1 Tax=unclassified Oceanobacter TaxID=2620260 RepID=UPI002735637A|nr:MULTISPECIES: ABC transporter ATP-binding protein [unclassified Oceanobacter]MDP2608576.1 ABC transporter ATP-binding protein [Oceanobacter sp. 1_MG-2023]MDP2611662.1 ABC transporter ATP-binding protein [Oceanobacter sp. 2_MG-2023]